MGWREAQQRLAMAPRVQPRQGSPLGGALGGAAGAAVGGALGGPLGASAGKALGGQLGGQGTVNPMAAAGQVAQANQGQLTDWMQGAIGFNKGGPVYLQGGGFGDWWSGLDRGRRNQFIHGAQDFRDQMDEGAFDTRTGEGAFGAVQNLYGDDSFGGYDRLAGDVLGAARDDWKKGLSQDQIQDIAGEWVNIGSGTEESWYDAAKNLGLYNLTPEEKQEIASGKVSPETQAKVQAAQKAQAAPKPKPKPRQHTTGSAKFDIPIGEALGGKFSVFGDASTKGGLGTRGVRYDREWGGGGGAPLGPRREGEMSMEEYAASGPEAAAADAQLAEAMGGMSEKEKRLAALLNMNEGGMVPQYKFLGGLLGAADKATRAADFMEGIRGLFEKRNKKLTGKEEGERRKKMRPEHKNMGGPIGGSQFMMNHGAGMKERVGPLAKTSYKSKGGEVWERAYHNPMMAKPAPAKNKS